MKPPMPTNPQPEPPPATTVAEEIAKATRQIETCMACNKCPQCSVRFNEIYATLTTAAVKKQASASEAIKQSGEYFAKAAELQAK